MKIPKQDVFYSACYHDEQSGEPFAIHGSHCRTYREAQKQAEVIQGETAAEVFVAECIVRQAKIKRKPKRKAA